MFYTVRGKCHISTYSIHKMRNLTYDMELKKAVGFDEMWQLPVSKIQHLSKCFYFVKNIFLWAIDDVIE